MNLRCVNIGEHHKTESWPEFQRKMLLAAWLFTLACAQYVPEPYGWACYRMATKRDWPDCKSLPASKQKACYCALPDFVRLTNQCLAVAVANDSDPVAAAELARSVSLCPASLNILDEHTAKPCTLDDAHVNSSIPVGKMKNPSMRTGSFPECEYIDPISKDDVELALSTARWRMCNDRRASRAGAALIGFWISVLVIKYIAHLMVISFPRSVSNKILLARPVRLFRSRLLNPALGRRTHSEPWLKNFGIRLPPRSFSILIIAFAILNYSLIFTHFPYTENNFIYTTGTQQWNKSLAIRSAFMIMWKLPLIFCFSSRNNIFLLTGHPWSLDTFSVFHRWIARITIIDVVIHGTAISLVKAEQRLYSSVWSVAYWQWGVCGVFAAALIAFQSILWVSRLQYEVFKAMHVVLGVIFVVATWNHVTVLPYGTKHCYAVFAIWGFDQAGRILRIIIAGRVNARLDHISDTMSIITIDKPPCIYSHCILPNSSFLFLHMPPFSMFWQSHPFSIVKHLNGEHVATESSLDGSPWRSLEIEADKSGSLVASSDTSLEKSQSLSLTTPHSSKYHKEGMKEQLVLAIRHRQGITKRLGGHSEGPITVALDGPYSNRLPLGSFDQTICIAGGIGITAHISHIQDLLEKSDAVVALYWAVANVEDMRWALDVLTSFRTGVNVHIYTAEPATETNKQKNSRWPFDIVYGRMNCSDIVVAEISKVNEAKTPPSTAIFACGPCRLNDDARLMGSWAIENSQSYVTYYEESFSW